MERLQMMEAVIRKYGFEDKKTIFFCGFAGDINNSEFIIQRAYDAIMLDEDE